MVFLTGNGFSPGVFCGNGFSFEGFEDGAEVVEIHCCTVFEKWDEGDKIFVVYVAFPFGEDDGVLGLESGVRGICVDHEDLLDVAIQIREVLVHVSNSVPSTNKHPSP